MTVVGTPPVEGTEWIPLPKSGTKMMAPSGLQLPPVLRGASQTVWGAPPDRSIVFSFPAAKNPRARLSGDQNGARAFSVPGTGFANGALNERTQMSSGPSGGPATNAMR